MRRFTLVALASVAAIACSQPASQRFPAGQLVDLSHAYDANAIFWPTADPFRLDKVADGVTPAGYYYAANNFFTSEHGGTHIDAPVHFAQGHQTVDEIPVDRLLGEAVVVDVTKAAEANPDYQVTVADFQRAEQGTPIPRGRDRADPIRFLAAVAGREPVSRHRGERRGRRLATALPRAAPGRGEMAYR